MTPDSLRQAGRLVAEHYRLDAAAVVMVGAIAATGHRGGAMPSAEERAELLSLAGDADHFAQFLEAATSRAHQFASVRWTMIQATAERFSAQQAVCA